MRNSYLPFIVLSLLCLANTALGQAINEKLFFSTIEPAISPMVSHLLEDRRGYIWFCTSTGVFRYDGTDVQSYKIDPSDDNALPSWPMYMAEAPDGILWISTHGGGLSRLDPMTQRFEHFYHDEEDPTSIAGNIPQFLTVDEEGFLWIGFDGEVGLDRFDPATRTFRHFRVAQGKKGRLQGRVLGNILPAKDRIYLATTAGLEYYDKTEGTFRFLPLREASGDTVYYSLHTLCQRKDGTIWMDLPNEGVRVFDPARDSTLLPDLRNADGDRNPKLEIILEGKDGRLWLGSTQEIWSLSPDQRVLQRHRAEFFEVDPYRNYINSIGFRSMLVDRYGLLWSGVDFFNPQTTLFEFYEIISPKTGRPLEVRGMNEANDSIMYLSTNEGDFLYRLGDRMATPFTFEPIALSTTRNFHAKQSRLIRFNIGSIISMYDLSADKLYQFPLVKNNKPYLIRSGDLFFSTNEDIWLSTWGQGLIRIKADAWRNTNGPIQNFDQWLPGSPDRPLPSKKLLGILLDSRDNVWVANLAGGLTRIDGQDETIRTFDYEPGKNGITSTRITDLAEDLQGNIWISTRNSGLNKFDPRTEQFTTYNHNNGLKNEDLFNLHVDLEGDLWLNGRLGITRFDPEEEVFTLYNQNDGLVSWEYNGSISKNTKRLIWGGTRGLHIADIHQLKNKSTQHSPIAITNIEAFDPDSKQLAALQPMDWSDRHLEFSYRQNVLNIRFAVLDFRNNSRHRYQYALGQGDQPNWIDLGGENQLRLNQLSPGTYQLYLRGSNSDQLWTELEHPLTLTIHPPFWQTTWAYALYLLLIGSALYWLYRNTLSRQLAKNEARQLKALERLRARFYTNITHEFRTPLTVILGMTEVEKDLPKAMQLIRRNGRRLLHLINQLLDLSRLDNNSLSPDYQRIEMVSFTRYLGESFQSLAENKQIDLQIAIDPAQLWMDMDEEMYHRIVFNLLSNAIKFTPPGGRIDLSLRRDAEWLALTVRDNGVGIPPEAQRFVFDRFYQVEESAGEDRLRGSASGPAEGTGIGLALVKELIQTLEGSIELASEMGRGAVFTIQLPIRRQATRELEVFTPLTTGQEAIEPAMPEDPISTDEDLPTLLIIEDNPDVIIYIKSLLATQYAIETAANGALGIERAIASVPDIIISDVMMPEKNGFEVVATLKQDERTSHIPIILLTAKATREDRLAGLQHGADAYLMKPFDKAELFVRLDQLVALRRALRARYTHAAQPVLTFGPPPRNDQSQTPALDDQFLQKIRRLIDEQIDDAGLDIASICQTVGMSATQLNRKIKALTGETPMSFIRKVRLHRAKELLQSTQLTVAEIAYDVGFTDASYFARAFKKEFGERPTDLR